MKAYHLPSDRLFIHYTFLQVLGLNKMNTGRISSLPIIIVSVSTIFENPLYSAKLAYGPTASNAGPTFDIQVRTAEKLLKNSCFTVYSPASDTILNT